MDELRAELQTLKGELRQVSATMGLVGKSTKVTLGTMASLLLAVVACMGSYWASQTALHQTILQNRDELRAAINESEKAILGLQKDLLHLRTAVDRSDATLLRRADLRETLSALRSANPTLVIPSELLR